MIKNKIDVVLKTYKQDKKAEIGNKIKQTALIYILKSSNNFNIVKIL